MSTTSRRFVAVAVAAIIAVVTGIAVGLVSPERTCRPAAGGKVSCTVAMFAPVPAVVGVAGALTAAVCSMAVLGAGRRRRAAPAPAPAPAVVAGGAPAGPAPVRPRRPDGRHVADRDGEPTTLPLPPVAGQADADRATLIEACIYVRDRTTSRALADRLGGALTEAGVRTVEPAGARFDPARHEAGGAAPIGDPAKVGTIAAVEVPGYTDRDGRPLRVPVVTVYRAATVTDPEAR
jgi:hypothetical protein